MNDAVADLAQWLARTFEAVEPGLGLTAPILSVSRQPNGDVAIDVRIVVPAAVVAEMERNTTKEP